MKRRRKEDRQKGKARQKGKEIKEIKRNDGAGWEKSAVNSPRLIEIGSFL